MQAWKDGRLEGCTPVEFVQSLRRYAGYADEEFKFRSDPAAHLGERLNAAAAVIEAMSVALDTAHSRITQLCESAEKLSHDAQKIIEDAAREVPIR